MANRGRGDARSLRDRLTSHDHAPNTRQASEEQVKGAEESVDWRKIRTCLKEIAKDLCKLEERASRMTLRKEVKDVLAMIDALKKQGTGRENPGEERLTRMEAKLDKLMERKTGEAGITKEGTWANVAAQAARTASEPLSKRPAVRVRIPGAEEKSAAELLAEVKPVISGAYAVRPLRSGDVEVMVPDQMTKDKALNQQVTGSVKILRQDYPVEIWGVPLTTQVARGRSADNAKLIQIISFVSRSILPAMAINKIKWIHDEKGHETRLKEGKSRGTLVMSFPTQAIQHEVIRKGLVIESQHSEAVLHDHGAQIKLCFRCNHWGHTQSACGKQVRCDECAEPHQTKDCMREKVSCVNCDQAHRAWQRANCRTFQAYLQTTQTKRAAAMQRTAAIRVSPVAVSISAQQPVVQPDGFTVVNAKKRGRSPEVAAPPKRSVGRPAYTTMAANDSNQTKLLLGPARRVSGTPARGMGTSGSNEGVSVSQDVSASTGREIMMHDSGSESGEL